MSAATLTPYPVCPVGELPLGKRKIVTLKGRSIGVFNIGGRYFALQNRCPHRGAPVCEGRLGGFFTASEPYAPALEREGEILRCPWHGWEFDVTTGRSVCSPEKVRVKSYPAGVEPPPETARVEKYDVTESEGQVVVWIVTENVEKLKS